MTTVSKNYEFPTGYFSTIYNYLCDTKQLDRTDDSSMIDLLKDFGYPEYIIPYLGLEFRGYVFNNAEAEIDWTKGLIGLEKNNEPLKGKGKEDSYQSDDISESSETPDLSSSS